MTRLSGLMLATFAIFGVTSAGRADGPASGEVTGVSVQPSPGRADVIINVRGAVEVRDFMLERPDRLVTEEPMEIRVHGWCWTWSGPGSRATPEICMTGSSAEACSTCATLSSSTTLSVS